MLTINSTTQGAARAVRNTRSVSCQALPSTAARRAVILGALVLLPARSALALIPDEEDESLIEKSKANRAKRLSEQPATTRTFMQAEGLPDWTLDKELIRVQKAVYRLADAGTQLEAGDVKGASRTLTEPWVGEFTAATSIAQPSKEPAPPGYTPVLAAVTATLAALATVVSLIMPQFTAFQAKQDQQFATFQAKQDQQFATFQAKQDQQFTAIQLQFTKLDQQFTTFQAKQDQQFFQAKQDQQSFQAKQDQQFTAIQQQFTAIQQQFTAIQLQFTKQDQQFTTFQAKQDQQFAAFQQALLAQNSATSELKGKVEILQSDNKLLQQKVIK